MSELPKGWVSTIIGDVLRSQSDGKLIHQGWSPRCHVEAAEKEDWGVLKTTSIQDGFFLENYNKKLPLDKEPRERIEVHCGDLLMTNAGPRARCGITTLVKSVRPKLMLSGKMYRMRFNEAYIYPGYIEACLRSEKVKAEIDSRKTGMSESGLNLTQARFLTVPLLLAPYNEQIRIANKLDSILAKVDKAQARLNNIPSILKRFRQSVLAAATSGELTKEWRASRGVDIEEWTDTKLSEVATSLDPNPSHRYPKSDSSGVPILSTQQFVGESGWTTDKAKLVNREFYEERKEKTGFFENDIIFARKGRLGLARFAPTNMEFVFSHTVFIVRASEKIQPEFLLWYLKDERSLEWLVKEMNSNTGVPTLGKGVFEKLPIHLPCLEEQSEIILRIEQFLSRANKIEKQYLDAKARLDRLTQSILAKAFRGELVPQDPTDEPAEQLLERILKEREQDKPKKKTTKKRATKAKVADKG